MCKSLYIHSGKFKSMKKLFFKLLAGWFIWNLSLNAQVNQIYKEHLHDYNRAVRYFELKNYDAAHDIFIMLKQKPGTANLFPDIDYYLTEIDIRQGDTEALEKIYAYLNRYPESPYRQMLSIHAIDRLFAQGNLREVKKMIDNTDLYDLPRGDQERLNFYSAYIALKENNLNKAKRLFKTLLENTEFEEQARYYLGYIAYLKNNPVEAQRYFSKLKQSESIKRNVPYYYADMYYRQGMFEKAIEEGLKVYNQLRGKEKSQLAKIIGSSYFNLKQYDKAIPYLKAYHGKKGKWNNKDYYELGYAYYQAGQCGQAVNYFNKIIHSPTPLAQNAYYHLAKCYLKSGEKAKALNAFKKVSEMDFDSRIKEDAWYNYIKLGYETGNPYETMDDAVKSYLKTFPGSMHKQELQDLLINSYLTSRNYTGALEAMKKNGMTARPEFQKVAFLRGMELFNEGKYDRAIKLFDISLKHGNDKNFRDKATFWKAEALYRLGKYHDALVEYKDYEMSGNQSDMLHFENNLLPYNLGYVYFKLKDYPQAAKYFNDFISNTMDARLKKDAYLRLGDSYFGAKKYWPAMEAYNKAIALQGAHADYAFFRKAISYGFVGRTNRKIEELNKFLQLYPGSKLRDRALYQLGSTYLNRDLNTKAIQTFKHLLNEFPKSSYVPVSMLKTGLAYYNQGKKNQAKQYFKDLIKTYPKTPEAIDAAEYLKSIYIDENNPDEYVAFINSIPGFHVETGKLEQEIFQAAQEKYFNGQRTAAKDALQAYLKRFPDGAFAKEAHYYLAKIALKEDNKPEAQKHFKILAAADGYQYQAEALRFLATQALRTRQSAEAESYLKKLENVSASSDDILFAVANLMRIYNRTGDMEKAADYARKVLSHPSASEPMKDEANLILARQAFKQGDDATAKQLYDKILQSAQGKTAAEAMYYKAYFQHKDRHYKASNKTIVKLTKTYPGYKYWGAKALVLMAENMYAKGDVFNATYILENIIKKFQRFPEIVQEANTLLDRINNEQSQKNTDVPKTK